MKPVSTSVTGRARRLRWSARAVDINIGGPDGDLVDARPDLTYGCDCYVRSRGAGHAYDAKPAGLGVGHADRHHRARPIRWRDALLFHRLATGRASRRSGWSARCGHLHGQPVVIMTGIASCVPTGTPLLPISAQTRVIAT